MQPNNDDRQFTPVMDVQHPTSSPPQPQPPTVIQPSGSLGRPATMEYTRPRPDDPSTRSFTPEPQQSMPQFSSAKHKKSKKGWLIGLFILLILAAGGAGAYYYFMIYNKEQTAPAQSTTTETTTTETTTIDATPEGVDRATEQIDQKLNGLNDSEDFTANDVSDDGLGL